MLSIRSLCSLPSLLICTVVRPQSVCKLYVRLLCSLPSLVICTVVSQVGVLPSYNSKATVSLLCSLLVPIYPNLFEFCRVFEWKERVWEHLGTWFISAIFPHRSRIHTRLDKVFIQAFGLACEVCVEVSPLCSLPTTVCEVADSVVCQVAMLPSFNSLWG